MRNTRRLAAVLLFCSALRSTTAAAEAKPWDHGDLQIGPDKRTIVHADGTPFFWLGDTAWMMIHRASDEEVDRYYANRAALGFNVTLQGALGEIGQWNQPNRTAAPADKTGTTARQLVEKTKDLAHKIAEAKAAGNNGGNGKKGKSGEPKPQETGPGGKPTGLPMDRIPGKPARIAALVGPAGDESQMEAVMQQFNAQFAHFGDDAPACDICGSITVRNGTCYKCFNCGNSMGCS